MPLTIHDFQIVANSTYFSSRDISIGKDQNAKLGNFFFSAGKKVNNAVMQAFKHALEEEYGVLGTHAFDTVLGSRNQLNKSLRACDVKATLSKLETLRQNRFIGEINRQLDTSPKFRELPDELRSSVRKALNEAPFKDCNLSECKTPADVADMAARRINAAIKKCSETVKGATKTLDGRKTTESPAKPNEPMGLRNLKTIMEKGTTSVEDRVKNGTLGTGMRINRSNTNPLLLEKLKTNGVEPGFIYRNDWSKDDTHGFMSDINSEASKAALQTLKDKNPAFAAECEKLNADGTKKTTRQQIMLAGRAHPSAVAAASEFLLEKAVAVALGTNNRDEAVSESVANLAKAVKGYFSERDLRALDGKVSDPKNAMILREAKLELFVPIRDAVMGVKKTDAEYSASPVFKHFADRNIMKLDYNENDRIFKKGAAHAGSFMRPERILTTRKPILGQIYRLQTASSANSISAGAVTEALANDLTRLAGVPAQELQIVRGQYSDGHPKLMLQATFADGYKDMEAGFIKDGRIVSPNDDSGNEQQLESLGKYKAFFLLTADRDAVGKRGQNKGFAHGKFFAIDPGHSLEGNAKYLDVADDFSFKDTYGKSTKPRFKNFSVFDDDTRFAKLQGLLNLRSIAESGAFKNLFNDYRKAFSPAEEGISDAEKAMRVKITEDINKKETEFNESLSKLLKVGGMQLEMYDALKKDGPAMQEGAIETIANLEKLTSPTTWTSKHGEVALKHLEVKPETRLPWRAGVVGSNLVYHCDKRIPQKAFEILTNIAEQNGAKCTMDAFGTTRLVIPKDSAERFFAAINEGKVAQLTHPKEYEARSLKGDGLKEAALYEPFEPATDFKDPDPPLKPEDLPQELDLEDASGYVIRMPKIHYEKMATTMCSGYHRPRSVGELRAQMQARVLRGTEILRALYSGNVSRFEANEFNISALTIALHAAALKKGEFMYRGSFSIEDQAGNIARWLDTADKLYLRTSTHALPYQSMKVDGHLNMPRGYDVREGMGGLLNGMRTFHYFSLPDVNHLDDGLGGSGPRRRLFLKCETFGIYLSTAHFHPHNKADARLEGMKTRSYEFGDICESIAHGASLLVSKFTSKLKEGIRKENLPPTIAYHLKEAERALRVNGFIELAEKTSIGTVLDGDGIGKFLNSINVELRKMTEENAFKVADILWPHLDRIDEELIKINGSVDTRMGNEIMLDEKNFY